LLELKNIWKTYDTTPALAGVDLKVRQGETVVIMGPSGCGKSTLIRCINRLTEPDMGDILVNGDSVLGLSQAELMAFRRKVGFVFQQFHLIGRLTVLENVMFHLVLAGFDRGWAEAQAAAALAKVGLSHVHERKPDELSGGQQQRVAIARALAAGPELMLWDEPTASLDPILVGEVLEVMENLVRTTQTTMVIVTHEVSFALRVAHRIVLMDQGQIVEEGPPEVIFKAPVSEIGLKYKKLLVS
jgi:polar amino acid transport system ATP-binding protein